MFVKRVKHHVFVGYALLSQHRVRHLDGVRNVINVGVFAEIAATHWSGWMGAFDLNRAHFPTFQPMMQDHGIVEEALKTNKANVLKFVEGPRLNPSVTPFQMFWRNRDGSVVVDDQLLVFRDSKIEFHAVKVLDGMPQTFNRVFGGLVPSTLRGHDAKMLAPALKLCLWIL